MPDTRRLAMMNLMLHDSAVDDENSGILFGDTLSNEGKALPQASLILANPPFGTKQGGGIPTRNDLVHYTSNKQLAFLHLMYHKMLKPGGRAAVVLPDNVLFEGSTGQTIGKDLMEKCNLHTILRLPTGSFYAAGVKTNVLFFSKPTDINQEKGNTKNVWVYDLRANIPQFGKRTVLTQSHFDAFYQAVGNDLTQMDENARQAFVSSHKDKIDSCRLRCFTREKIVAKDDSLDLAWIRDDSTEDASTLPALDILINQDHGNKVIKPLAFQHETTTQLIEHGERWHGKIKRLVNSESLSSANILLPFEAPKSDNMLLLKAYNEVVAGFKELDVEICQFGRY